MRSSTEVIKGDTGSLDLNPTLYIIAAIEGNTRSLDNGSHGRGMTTTFLIPRAYVGSGLHVSLGGGGGGGFRIQELGHSMMDSSLPGLVLG